MRRWSKDLTKGEKGETMLLRWFGGKNGFNDLLINAEIKNTWHGGKITIEEDSIIEKGKKGWLYTTKADCVIFVDYENEQAIAVETSELRNRYMKIKEKYELFTQKTEQAGEIWTSTHRCIPINQFCHVFLRHYERIY